MNTLNKHLLGIFLVYFFTIFSLLAQINSTVLSFDGNDYLFIADNEQLEPENITIEGWFKFENLGGVQVLISKHLGTNFLDSYLLWFDRGALKGTISDNSGFTPVIHNNLPFQVNVWYHLAYTFDDENDIQSLFVNGQLVESNENIRSIDYDDQALFLGASNDGGTPSTFFQGKMDEVRIWNKVLSETEIRNTYDISLSGNEEGLIGYWRLNEGAGQTTEDASSFSSDARLGALIEEDTNDPSWNVEDNCRLEAGLAAYFPMNGNPTDVINGNLGTVNGGASLTTDRFGKADSAYEFDGIDDYIDYGDSTEYRFAGDYSISLWVFTDSLPQGGNFLNKRQPVSPFRQYSISLDEGSPYNAVLEEGDNVAFFQRVDQDGNSVNDKRIYTDKASITTGWHQITVTNRSLGRAYLYIDNQLIDSTGLRNGSTEVVGYPLLVGGTSSDIISGYFKGKIDDIRLYQRFLSREEVGALYECEKPIDNPCSNNGDDADGDGICANEDCDDSLETGANCSTDCQTFYLDADGDTFGSQTDSVTTCVAPMGYVSNNSDCDDGNPNKNIENCTEDCLLEEFFYDSRSSVAAKSTVVLNQNTTYNIEITGTYTVWANFNLSASCGALEAEPMFMSGGATRTCLVTNDGMFQFGNIPRDCPASDLPKLSDFIKIRIADDFESIQAYGPFEYNPAHQYTFQIVGENKLFELVLLDPLYTDNCGQLRVKIYGNCDNPLPCDGVGDMDEDGICADLDCDDTNPNIGAKQTPNTTCDDGNPNTINDIIQSDSCTCIGEMPPPPTCANNGGDMDEDGICADVDCDDSPETGANCSTGCQTFYLDADGDTFGSRMDSVMTCVAPMGYVENKEDCDDNNPEVYPDAPEIPCNGIDENCNGIDDSITDEPCDPTYCPEYDLNIGQPCDDNDPNTEDEWLEAGCKCVGKVIGQCDVEVVVNGNTITVNNLNDGHNKALLFDRTFDNPIDVTCSYWENCGGTKTFSGLRPGVYALQIQSFSTDWTKLICDFIEYVEIEGATTDNDCESITIQLTNTTLTVDNLPTLNTIVDVFDLQYKSVANCIGNCGNAFKVESLAIGSYIVRIKVYDIDWNFVCEQEERIEVKSPLAEGSEERAPIPTSEPSTTSRLKVFPNPATDHLTVAVGNFMGKEVEIIIYDILGKVVFEQAIDQLTQSSLQINTANFQEGLYILSVQQNGKITSKKFMRKL